MSKIVTIVIFLFSLSVTLIVLGLFSGHKSAANNQTEMATAANTAPK